MVYLSLITQGRLLPRCGTTDPVSRAAVLAKAGDKAPIADVRKSFVRLWTSEPNMVFVRIMVALSTFWGLLLSLIGNSGSSSKEKRELVLPTHLLPLIPRPQRGFPPRIDS